MYKIGVIGTGFIARGLVELLDNHKDYTISAILTRTDPLKREDFPRSELLSNELSSLIESSDLIVECSGDVLYATDTIEQILKANIPVVTMNSEFHITTGSYFVDKGLVTEADGDQPGALATLHEEAIEMGFTPLVYGNIKGFLNHTPTKDDMEYWADRSNISLQMVTSFTDGTKIQIEQTLIANGLGATILREGLEGLHYDDMVLGGNILASKAKDLGSPVSDYLLSAKLPAGVFLVAQHPQKDALNYFKLGDGPYYVLDRTFHLCHLEIVKTIKRVLSGGGVLLDNSKNPTISVASVAKRDLKVGDKIEKAIGSFDVRGIAIKIEEHRDHIPVGLCENVTIKRDIKEGEKIYFDDVDIAPSRALEIWREIVGRI
jgi:predicted homoserine dehydrogenase-like protein